MSVSELQCEVGGTGALQLGEEPLSIPSSELSTRECALWCHLFGLTKYTIVGTSLNLASTVGMQAIGPSDP